MTDEKERNQDGEGWKLQRHSSPLGKISSRISTSAFQSGRASIDRDEEHSEQSITCNEREGTSKCRRWARILEFFPFPNLDAESLLSSSSATFSYFCYNSLLSLDAVQPSIFLCML
ncbi:hypothetical protein ACLOJK_040616 [Asimina triloba]